MSERPRVLVVDDDEGIRDLVAVVLADQGYEVSVAEHGAAALDLVRQTRPAAILLDMRMPVMDGWAFAAAYRQLPAPHAPIIVLTAAQDAPRRAAEIRADAALGKPFTIAELTACVAQYAHPS
jgi:two-component system, chemotaxis family, chemotaxis protein CheY